MWESLDLRKFPRLNIRCDIEILEQKTSLRLSTMTENIGLGGVCVILQKEIPRFTSVHVRLDVGDGLPLVECAGKICWVVRSKTLFKNESRYDTGVQFTDLQDAGRERIMNMINRRAGK